MTPEVVIDIFRQAVFVIILLTSALVIPGLIVGLLIAVFQAATQINEMSLSFVPKLLITFFSLAITGPWMLNLLLSYTKTLISEIPMVIG